METILRNYASSKSGEPYLADVDADGDLDLFLGDSVGNTSSSATPVLQAHLLTPESGNTPFGLMNVGPHASSALADIDDDGDLDLFIGNTYGQIFFLRNTAATPSPGQATTANGAFGIGDVISLNCLQRGRCG